METMRETVESAELFDLAYSDNYRSIRLIQKAGGVILWEEPTEIEAAKAVMTQFFKETGLPMRTQMMLMQIR